jgi:hypothetical protein
MDGTHITCCLSAAERQLWWNWKGFVSQNCLACCSFNLWFQYILNVTIKGRPPISFLLISFVLHHNCSHAVTRWPSWTIFTSMTCLITSILNLAVARILTYFHLP